MSVRAAIKAGIIAGQAYGFEWTKEYDGNSLPDAGGDYDWTKTGGEDASVAAGILHLTDDSAVDKISYYYAPGFSNATGWTVELSIKVVAYGAQYGVGMYVQDGTKLIWLTFSTTRIKVENNDEKYYDTTLNDAQHVIRLTGEGAVYKVYLDGNSTPVIDGALTVEDASDQFHWGCPNNAATGEAYWDFVRYYTGGAVAP